MTRRHVAAARINLKLLILICLALGVAGGGAVGLHFYRKRNTANNALRDGEAAYAKQNWKKAASAFKTYLSKYPDDAAILEKSAEANSKVRPRTQESTGASIAALRRLLRQRRGDKEICGRLARWYYTAQNYEDSIYVADQRLTEDPKDVEALLWKGQSMAAQGRREDARKVLTELTDKVAPTNVDAYLALSNIALQERTDKAVAQVKTILDKAIATCPQPGRALAQRARYHRLIAGDHTKEGNSKAARSELDAARADLEAADALKSRDPGLRLMLCEEWINHTEYARAEAELDALSDPDMAILASQDLLKSDLDLPIRTNRAEVLLRLGDGKRAVLLAKEGLDEKLPKYSREQFLPAAAKLYLVAGDVAAARKCAEQLREKLSKAGEIKNTELILIEAAVAQAEGRPYEAIEKLLTLVSGSAPSTRALWALWNIYKDMGQDRMGLRWLEEYAARVPGDFQACTAMSRAYAGRDWDKSLRYAQMAGIINPSSLEARLLEIQARLLPNLKRDSSLDARPFVEILEKLKTEQPSVVSVRTLLATILELSGKTAEAEKEIRAAVTTCSDPMPAYMQLADLLVLHGRVDDALAVCREAGAKVKDSSRPWIKFGEIATRAERQAEAITAMEQAVKTLKGDEKLLVGRARAELMLTDKDRASGMAALRALCAENPRNVPVRSSLLSQPELQKDPKAAQELVDQIKTIEGKDGLEWQCEQAGIWLRANQWKDRQAEVLAMLQRCIEADPTWQVPVMYLGAMYDLQGDPDKAIETYRNSLAAAPTNVGVANRLLELLERQQRFSEAGEVLSRIPGDMASPHTLNVALGREDYATAIKELQRRINNDPKDGTSRAMLAGLIYNHRNDETVKELLRRQTPPVRDPVAYSMQLLDEAAAAAPDLLAIASVKAGLLRSEGRKDEALALINGLLKKRSDFAPLLLRAQHYAALGELELAEKDFDLMTALPDAPADAYIAAVQFLRAINKADKAVPILQRAINKYPDSDGIKGQYMRLLLARESVADRERGKKLLEELLEHGPNNPDLLWVKATNLLAEKNNASLQEAIALMERVVKLSPRAVGAHLQLISIAAAAGDQAEALRLLDRAMASNPDDPALRVRRAQMEVVAGHSSVARQILASVIGLPAGKMDASTRVDAYLLAAKLDQLSGKSEQAISDLENLSRSEAGEQFPQIWLTLSDLYRFKGDIPTAEKRFETARALDPQNETVLFGHMQMLAAKKDYDGLATWLQQLRRDHPTQTGTLLNGAALLASAESPAQLKSACEVVEAVIQDNPKLADAFLVLAHLNYAMKDMKATQQTYERLLKVDPNNWEALNDMAWITSEDGGNPVAGLELANRGLAKDPKNVHLLDTRGVILTKLGKYAEAERDLQQCIIWAKDVPRTLGSGLLHLARAQIKQNKKSEAARNVKQALTLDEQQRVFTPVERTELKDLERQSR